MNILIPVISVSVIGLLCAIMLAVASKVLAVPEDETFVAIRQCLPGANCGACGYAGCDGYAHALADGIENRSNLCIPGGNDAAVGAAAALGVEAQDAAPKKAVVLCCGDTSCTTRLHEYHGIQSCAACNLLFSGDGSCTHGCLGYGDCAAACPQNAIVLTETLAHIMPSLCIGCGLCAKACPNGLIKIIPETATVTARCSNTDKGAMTRKVCSKGCIGCKKCEKTCEAGAITVVNNHAVIDYNKCTGCGHCAEICTTGCIVDIRIPSSAI